MLSSSCATGARTPLLIILLFPILVEELVVYVPFRLHVFKMVAIEIKDGADGFKYAYNGNFCNEEVKAHLCPNCLNGRNAFACQPCEALMSYPLLTQRGGGLGTEPFAKILPRLEA